ncbi:Hsp20/alpha crystallin family protein [Streptomyces sp. NBC_00250]|uniref:Hsp20/alpha crystallin family protein n=1 Tax=Streptomyces sp. NBC_00250 TaxID=2903641 RepID=UPI002E2CE078|nr:Hsp20/alpha crystallin family protein [Streptomyces sp. NBC_00250]
MSGGKVERRRSLFPDFNDLFNSEFPGLPGWRPATAAHSIPVEMSTGDGGCVLRAELPGMDPEDITITVDDDLVTVRAERGESEQDKEHSEFRYGAFRRTVRLPATIPADGVDASYKDGVLTVRVPMPDEAGKSGRTIQVKRGDSASQGETS